METRYVKRMDALDRQITTIKDHNALHISENERLNTQVTLLRDEISTFHVQIKILTDKLDHTKREPSKDKLVLSRLEALEKNLNSLSEKKSVSFFGSKTVQVYYKNLKLIHFS